MAHQSNSRQTNESKPVARRGTQWLSQNELQAHLANVVRLENIGVLLGAGASVEKLGGSTAEGIWKGFCSDWPASNAWLAKNGFIPDDHVDALERFVEISERLDESENELGEIEKEFGADSTEYEEAYRKHEDAAEEREVALAEYKDISQTCKVDVEKLMDTLDIARLEWERTKSRELSDLNSARTNVLRSIINSALLQEEWWKSPSKRRLENGKLKDHRSLLLKLVHSRQPGQASPWVFTTNYDLAIEWAAESVDLKVINGFDGLHVRSFSPHNFDLGYRNTLARGEARFGIYNIYLVKLHGSLTWRMAKDESICESSSTEIWPALDNFLKWLRGDVPCQLIYPSSAKYLQTVGFVSGELFRRFTEFLAKPQSCLITCGYSFSDEHLNRILISALQNPTLQLVVYIPEAKITGKKFATEQCSEWAKRIIELKLPQVTIVGGGCDAHFTKLVSHLPDPALLDEQEHAIRKTLMDIARGASTATPNAGQNS